MRLTSLATIWGLTASLVAGCTAVDQFSSRASTYNDQAETIKEQQFLTNILRAAYREPLEFSDFTQVTGQASVSGTTGFSLPFSEFPATAAHSDLALPSATLSGTQSFTIANLDTQAFYEGILSPIPLTTVDYYMEADYAKALVLTLFVSHITLQSEADPMHTIGFYNSYYGNYAQFKSVLQAAIDLGLTTQSVNVTQPVGPPMTAAQLPDLRYLTALGEQHMMLKTYELGNKDPNLTIAQRAAFERSGVNEYYRLVTTTQKSQFCFASRATPAELAAANQDLLGVMTNGRTLANIQVPDSAICGTKTAGPADDDGDDDAARAIELDMTEAGAPVAETFKVVITTRSVEEILYYLGEWARAELQIGNAAAAPPLVRTEIGDNALFAIRRHCDASMPSVAVRYFGGDYCMQIDSAGADRSAEVMEIVSQLFALNNSAQNLPSPNVISVLSP